MNHTLAPESLDIIPTSKCNLNCSMCWGPFHYIDDKISTKQWKEILRFFKKNGTKKIIFTGGEPLLRDDIIEIMAFSKKLGYTTTLSTNTLLLKNKEEIIKYVDQIGIPIDGSNKNKNNIIRRGNPDQFDTALEALKSVKKINPKIQVTVRTVVSALNKDDLVKINSLLESYKYYFDRWKLYQFTPVNYGEINEKNLFITNANFNSVCEKIISLSKIKKIKIYPKIKRLKKYVFIGSNGDVYGVGENGNYQKVANVLEDNLNTVLNNIPLVYNKNSKRD